MPSSSTLCEQRQAAKPAVMVNRKLRLDALIEAFMAVHPASTGLV
jgi:hypothetical protein